ncbi:hypothetical protein M9Y10_009680 [Tritrichomonas musculus]|uniref:Helicase ATP-binding domain-containing protein n=1 Tax=Tritrichomonas musculus TaxID=1915356 RepID=A0ABR2IP25_9EUKA
MSQFQILGVQVDFPYTQIYPSQRALIANSIRAFKNQENALLESPTGTGKALALLCSALAYQKYVVDNQVRMENNPTNDLIRANDKFSIFLGSDNNQKPDKPTLPSQNKVQAPRIWFTSRTHSQLKQLIDEYKKLPYNPPMTILASRKKLCLNSKVAKSEDPTTECRKLVDNNKCPYKMEGGIPEIFRPGGRLQKYDIEDLAQFGRKHFRCPYHMSLVILSKADLIFCPYNYILDPVIKGMLELSLLNSILIIDEAHNIENICREAGTFRTTNTDFIVALKSLSNLKQEKPTDNPTENPTNTPTNNLESLDLEIVTTFVESLYDWFKNKISFQKFLKLKEKVENVSDVLKEWNLNQMNWPSIEKSITQIISRKAIVEKSSDQVHFENFSLLNNFFVFLVLVFQNNMENVDDFKIAFQLGDGKENEDCMLIICLTPSIVFKCVSREVHSVILASGTLSPLSTFSSELGTSFPIQLSANHIIDKDQVESYIITHGQDGSPFISTYQNLMQNKDTLIINFGNILIELLPHIPGGVLVFLPSYKFLSDVVSTWKKKNIWWSVNNIKKIFLENTKTISKVYEKYKQRIDSKSGGVLIGVCRGSMSEGMDFKDDQARAVFIFGIPYPSSQDIEIRLKKDYNDQLAYQFYQSSQSSQSSQSPQSSQSSQTFSDDSQNQVNSYSCRSSRINDNKPITGSDWYETSAFRSIFQAIGRCIRHRDDYGTIFLIDQRFQNFISKFPRWVQSSFVKHNGIEEVKQNLITFYQNMQIKYPIKVQFNRGEKIVFDCSKCHNAAINILSIDFDQTEQTTRKGFLELAEAGNDINCIFLSRNSKFLLNAQPNMNENIWSQEDLSIYNPVHCSFCGQKLGVHILASTREDSMYTNGFLFLFSKLTIHKEEENKPKPVKSPDPKNKKKSKAKDKNVPEKGQQLLNF